MGHSINLLDKRNCTGRMKCVLGIAINGHDARGNMYIAVIGTCKDAKNTSTTQRLAVDGEYDMRWIERLEESSTS